VEREVKLTLRRSGRHTGRVNTQLQSFLTSEIEGCEFAGPLEKRRLFTLNRGLSESQSLPERSDPTEVKLRIVLVNKNEKYQRFNRNINTYRPIIKVSERFLLFWDVTQHRLVVTDVSGQLISLNFKVDP